MIVDLDSSHATIANVLAMAKRPVISRHGGVLGTCNVNRNLSDDEVRGIAKTGGVIGIVTSRARSAPSTRRTWRRQSPMSAMSSASTMSGLARLRRRDDGRFRREPDGCRDAGAMRAFPRKRSARSWAGNVLRVLAQGSCRGLKSRTVIPAQTALPFVAGGRAPLGLLEGCTAPAAAIRAVALRG